MGKVFVCRYVNNFLVLILCKCYNPQGAYRHLMDTEIIRRTLELRSRGSSTYGRERRTWIADAPVGRLSTPLDL